MSQAYHDACIILPTRHAKLIAIAPLFLERLGASVLEYIMDTDMPPLLRKTEGQPLALLQIADMLAI
jgi:hypothetical protein